MKTFEIKTCLLVTDDPDDHQNFTEAIGKVAMDTIVLVVVDSTKARELLLSGKHIPDHLMIDLSMNGLEIESFLTALREHHRLNRVPIMIYGSPGQYADIADRRNLIFFAKEYEYSSLQSVLNDFLNDPFA